MKEVETLPLQYAEFPQTRQQAPAKKSGHIHNPHHPHVRRAAAQGMTLAAPGTPSPQQQAEAQRQTHEQQMRERLAQHQALQEQGINANHLPPQPIAASSPVAAALTAPASFDIPVTPNSQTEFVSFALPSNFMYYDFKEIYIKPLKGLHFAKLNRAREEESMLHVVEVVSSVLWSPDQPDGMAFKLTLPDFYACLYWLRLNSFLKHGFTHQTMCRSKAHHEMVDSGKAGADTLRHVEMITKATMATREAKPLDMAAYQLEHPELRLTPATMRDVLDITTNDNIDKFVARIAASIQPVGMVLPLSQRMEFVDFLSADDIATAQAFEQAVSDYGVEESLRWKCKFCGHNHKDEIQLDAHSFFPSAA